MWKAQDGVLLCRQNAALTCNGTGSCAAVTCIAAPIRLSGNIGGSPVTPSGWEGAVLDRAHST